jgi:hypothetical protein
VGIAGMDAAEDKIIVKKYCIPTQLNMGIFNQPIETW